ncbi:AEC family transporter [Nitrospira sp. NS4]|uniref:AEC family transporter n=1 Tax=Nitrospira sp. NS4 TaxID=3414498 RepID=UPI003C2F637C
MPTSLQAFLILFIVGAALRLSGLLAKQHAERLGTFVFSVTLPATILVSLDRVVFAPTAWKLPLAACLVSLPLVLASWPLVRLLHLARPTQGGFLLAVGCINSVYFAYPVALATFGEEGLAQAILFDLGQTTLTLTALYALALWHGTASPSARSSLTRLLSAPPLWALTVMLALKAAGLYLPSRLHDVLTPVHLMTTPLASLVLGLSISLDAVRRTWPLTCLGVAVRMGGGLLLGWIVTWLLGLTGLEQAVVILIAGMPSAVTAVIFAAETGLDEDLVASIVALSICLGVALLPWLPYLAAALLR